MDERKATHIFPNRQRRSSEGERQRRNSEDERHKPDGCRQGRNPENAMQVLETQLKATSG